jgi:uncharacterized membrane protein
MVDFLITVIALLFGWAVMSSKMRKIEERLERETEKRTTAEEAMAVLTHRIYALEQSAQTLPVAVMERPEPVVELKPAPLPASTPVFAVITPPPLPEPAPESTPMFASVEPPPIPVAPGPGWRERLRAKVGDQEWEALVGGNWLNKLGVLLLVVGVALLVGYEFTRVGPVGRVAIGLGVSFTMLIAGVLVERKPLYAIFGRGLIGGGWATLYFTTYAMHAVEAAKVIENPYLGSALLLIVACGMILHSLRYRSQTVSGLAYFIAFATLGLSKSTPFSVLALIPLAASLLVLAHRFDWFKMAVFGVFATYATCASRPDAGAPLATTQALFASYWLLFEAFDLLRLRRRVRGYTVESLILPMNAIGFLGLSAVKWYRSSPAHFYVFLAACGALYLVSAVIRALLGPPVENESTLDGMASGGYQGPITVSAALAMLSIFRRAPGIWIDAGLLLEGELLFLAGVRFGQTYLRQLASAVFTSLLARLLGTDVPAGDATLVIAKRAWMSWSPVAIVTAAVFYANRAMRVAEGAVYSSVAAALISLMLAFECPQQYLGVAWLTFAALLFELGFRARKPEFLFQSYAVGTLGTGAGLLFAAFPGSPDWQHEWLPIAIAAAIHYAITLRIRFGERGRVPEMVTWITSGSATAFLMVLAWKVVPGDYLGLTWLILGAALFELGIRKLPEQLRWFSYAASALGLARLVYFDVVLVHKGDARAEAISLGVAALVCSAMSARFFRPATDRIPDREREWARDLDCAAGTLFLMSLAWLELPSAVVALAWGILSLAILEIGFQYSLSRFRLIGNVASAAAFGRLFLANFTNLGSTLRISHRMLTVLPVVGSQYFIWRRYRDSDARPLERSFARAYLYAPAILMVVLMRFELGRSLAVVGWALFCVVLFRTGMVAKVADLRWQSYAIALLAFWRCWNTNFYIPESLAGIRGRVLAGALVTASFYAAQLLAPRTSGDGARGLLDRHSRIFFSLLASTLLAVLLFYEVSGGVLTMAWGVEALALLGAGFPLRDRVQRLSGLFLFMVCVLKLFLYDLRQLETINRILSFIVLGLILVSVSWIYTRFRDRIQRYL